MSIKLLSLQIYLWQNQPLVEQLLNNSWALLFDSERKIGDILSSDSMSLEHYEDNKYQQRFVLSSDQ